MIDTNFDTKVTAKMCEKFGLRRVQSVDEIPNPETHPHLDTGTFSGEMFSFPAMRDRANPCPHTGKMSTIGVYCVWTINWNFIEVGYLYPAGATTLAFEMFLSEDQLRMIWGMFIPYEPYLSKSHKVCALPLASALQMLKLLI